MNGRCTFYAVIWERNETIRGRDKGTAPLAGGIGPEMLSPAGLDWRIDLQFAFLPLGEKASRI